ncbi:hypothetical protein EV356DRAFT_497896 [Viridothelium virens]|uniref:FAD linked oxidase N-terminal domain-containing protein n=1 Tax=Viridothelium virens TaxID=1048519 RepID=A0A6A6GS93_VIRVR|nr:hypothetical protein EV356DRAFT_497896 [Viridothelium virens]
MGSVVHNQPCALAETVMNAGLQIPLPSDAGSKIRQDTYWSNSAKLTSPCVDRPKSAEGKSKTICFLVVAGEKFVIRKGGHTQYAGTNNIEGGVTIDLRLMDWTSFDEASETVDIKLG